MSSSDSRNVIRAENRLFDAEVLHVHECHSERKEIVSLITAEEDHSVRGDEDLALVLAAEDFTGLSTGIVELQCDILRVIDDPEMDGGRGERDRD